MRIILFITFSALTIYSCSIERNTIKSIELQTKETEYINQKDTVILFCADSAMRTYCSSVEFYKFQNQIVQIIIKGDSMLKHNVVKLYFKDNSLIKAEEYYFENEGSHVIFYYQDGIPITNQMKKDDGHIYFKNAALTYIEFYNEMKK